MSESSNELRAWLDGRLADLAEEDAQWGLLEQRALDLVTRSGNLLGTLQDAQRRAQSLVAALTMPAPAVDSAAGLVSTATLALRQLVQPATELRDSMKESGPLADSLAGLLADADEFAATVEMHATEAAQEVELTVANLTDAWPTRLSNAAGEIELSKGAVTSSLEQTLSAGLQESLEDVAESLEDVYSAAAQTFDDICDSIVSHADGIMDDTGDFLEQQRDLLTGGIQNLGATYVTLGEDLKALGSDLHNVYDLVATGMQSSGVGMNAGAESLQTVQQMMSGVS